MMDIYPDGECHILEIHKKSNTSRKGLDVFYSSDILKGIYKIKDIYKGNIQLIYMDPPFMTGQSFRYRQNLGEKGNLDQIAYRDKWTGGREEYLSFMRQVFQDLYDLLKPEGSFYLHVDYRASAYLRVILDEIFGIDNFLNEIIWHYQSGGRAKKHFSRKHDTILFYRKSKKHYFNIEAIGVERGDKKRNNMKKEIDEDGEIFWSINSGGKTYKYYQSSKIFPSDVWTDISHLHQKNPERTGYDTQKPEALLERMILASSKPGDYIGDFFAGSGTTLAVANRLNRRWIGIDSSIHSLNVCRKRLLQEDKDSEFIIYYDENKNISFQPEISIALDKSLDSNIGIELLDYVPTKEMETLYFKKNKNINLNGLEYVDYWAIGYIQNHIFYPKAKSIRDGSDLNSKSLIKMDGLTSKDIVIHVVDVWGNQFFRKL